MPPETDTLSDKEFNESFLSGRNQNLEDPKVEVVDLNDDGKLDAGVVDGDTAYFNFDGKSNFFNKTVTPDKVAPAIGNQILKRILGKAGGSLLSPQTGNKYEDGLVERRRLGLPGTASQRQVDSVKIVRFMMQFKRADSVITKD